LTAPERAASARSHAWTIGLGILVSLGLLAWATRNVDLADVGAQLRAARLAPLLAGVAIATSTFVMRAVRWGLFLNGPDGRPVPYLPRWHATALGFMGNNLLPLRAGEFIRVFAITRLGGVRLTPAITSIVVERVLDLLALLALTIVGLLVSGLPADATVAGVSMARIATIAGVVGSGALVVGVLMVARPQWTEAALRRLLPDGALRARLISIGHGVSDGLAMLRSPGRIAAVAAWSLALWVVNALSFRIMFDAFDIRAGFAGALLVQGALVLGVSVPSTPGYVGPFEAAIVAVLALYGVPDAKAFSFALAYHASTFLPIVLLGIWSLVRTPLSLGDLRRARE
jgi:uncharacterized protein (TIRG00374 family)